MAGLRHFRKPPQSYCPFSAPFDSAQGRLEVVPFHGTIYETRSKKMPPGARFLKALLL